MKRPIIGLVCALAILAAMFTGCAASADTQYANTAVVNNPDPADRLHLRAAPSSSAVSLGKYYNGVEVAVQSVSGGWALVKVGA